MNMVLVFDTETTGLDCEEDRIVQIAWVVLNSDLSPRGEWFSTFVWTDVDISESAKQVNNLCTDQVNANSIAPKEAMKLFLNAVTMASTVFAHSVVFDMGFVEATCYREGLAREWDHLAFCRHWVCSKEMAKPLFPEKERGPRLGELYDMFCGGEIERRHDALGDSKALAACLPHLVNAIRNEI